MRGLTQAEYAQLLYLNTDGNESRDITHDPFTTALNDNMAAVGRVRTYRGTEAPTPNTPGNFLNTGKSPHLDSLH